MTIESLASAILGFPWARVAYTFLIFALIAILGREIREVWARKPVTLGAFAYSDDGAQDAGLSSSLSLSIQHHMGVLNHKFAAEHDRTTLLEVDNKFPEHQVAQLPRGEFAPGRGANLIGDLNLTVQGVNLSQILATVRTRVSPSDEVSGSVSRREDRASATISWPSAPETHDDSVNNRLMRFSGNVNDDELAETVACSLAWAHAVGTAPGELRNLDHNVFCTFARNWSQYIDVRTRAESGEDLRGSDIETLKSIIRAMAVLINRNVEYSEIYLLRANAIDMLPEPDESFRSLAITDYRVYERRDEERELSEIRQEIQQTFQVTAVSHSVGFIRNRSISQSFVGTAWVIADNTIAVPTFVALQETPTGAPILDVEGLEFVVASSVGDPSAMVFGAIRVIAVTPATPGQSTRIALIEVPNLVTSGIKPLTLAKNIATPGESGSIIAFQSDGQQSVKPFHVLSVNEFTNTIFHDAETSPGSAGAPLLNDDQEVLGIHFGMQVSGNEDNRGVGIGAVGLAELLQQ